MWMKQPVKMGKALANTLGLTLVKAKERQSTDSRQWVCFVSQERHAGGVALSLQAARELTRMQFFVVVSLILFFFLSCMWLCVSVHPTHAVPEEARRGHQIPLELKLKVTRGSELPYGC